MREHTRVYVDVCTFLCVCDLLERATMCTYVYTGPRVFWSSITDGIATQKKRFDATRTVMQEEEED